MKREDNSGILLRRYRVPGRSGTESRILTAILAAAWYLAFVGAMGSVPGLWAEVSPAVLMIVGVTVCAIWLVLAALQWERHFFPAALTVLLMAALVMGKPSAEGACQVWNHICHAFTAATGWYLPMVQTTGGEEAVQLFLVLAGGLLAVLSLAAVQKARSLTAILTVLTLAAELLLFRQTRLDGWTAFAAAMAVLFLLSSGWDRTGKAPGLPTVLAAVLCALTCALLMTAAQAPELQAWMRTVKVQAEKAVHAARYETDNTTLPEGDFTQFDGDTRIGNTALFVTMECPEVTYLRGFVGDTFEEEVWSPLDTQVLAEQKDLLYRLNTAEFRPQAQFAAAVGQAEQARIIIENISSCSRYLYIPYNLSDGGILPAAQLQPGPAEASGFRGSRSYAYSVLCGASGQLQQALQWLQDGEDPAVLRFRRAESAYRELVHEQDLQVPEQFRARMGPVLDAYCSLYGSAEALTLVQAQDSALRFLADSFGGQEAFPLPLAEVGGHYQYATVAVLVLRYYGIPARYAEGYVITEELVGQMEPGTAAAVDNSLGRAWAEVYQDGVGWLPLDLTPGFEALAGKETEAGVQPVGVEGLNPNGEIGSEAGDGAGSFLSEGKEREEQPVDEADSEDELSSGGTMVRIRQALRWGLWLLLAALFLLLLAMILRWALSVVHRKKLFRSEDRVAAIGWIYADCAALLRKMGLDRGTGSMEPVCRAAGEKFGPDYGQACREMMELNNLALFSSRLLQEQQRQQMLDYYENTLRLFRKHVKWYRKFWLRWICCMY